MEKWKSIQGFEAYEVSDLGRVRKGHRICTMKPTQHGYLYKTLRKDGCRVYRGIHTLVAGAFLGACPEGFEVDHINRNKTDNRVKNLRYMDRTTNTLNSLKCDTASHIGKWYAYWRVRLRIGGKNVIRYATSHDDAVRIRSELLSQRSRGTKRVELPS